MQVPTAVPKCVNRCQPFRDLLPLDLCSMVIYFCMWEREGEGEGELRYSTLFHNKNV